MAWTAQQELAINKRGQNIIVSAGAGSGKTAVLSERILQYCKDGNDIRKLLVLTFTSAAASEMKERIRNKLIEANLLQQADYIDAAYITTFDSYSLSLVRKYYYKLDLSKDVAIMDGALIEVKTKQIVEELFTEYYRNQNSQFMNFLKKYSTQDDTEIIKIVEKLCKKFELIIDFNDFKSQYENKYYSIDALSNYVSEYESICENNVKELSYQISALIAECPLEKKTIKYVEQLMALKNNLNLCSDYDDYYRVLSDYSLPRIYSNPDEVVKELKDEAAKLLNDLKKNYFGKYHSKASMYEELLSIKDDILFLLDICDEVNNRLFEYKKSIMLFGFNDIAKFAIKLVKENDDVKEELKQYYNEILVDEYQDTSDIQETFLNIIQNNNMYMVGDIKQSIYRFRNANPYIFKDKYDNYASGIGGYKIDLTHNFRSRKEVLANINLLFNELMNDELGDANYRLEHQMIYGQTNYENINQNINFDIEYLQYKSDIFTDFTSEEKEAFIIAKEIKKIYNSSTKVLKGKEFVDVNYNDFAILIDKSKSFIVFKQIFEYLNIPLSIEADLNLKDSILPQLFYNILLIISKIRNDKYDKEYKHAIASIARSFLYEYSDNKIYDLIVNNKEYPIISDFKYLAYLNEISYSQLFYKICFHLGVYDKLSLIGDVDNSIVVLENIHNMFKMFANTSMNIDKAVEYLNVLLNSDIQLKYKLPSNMKGSVKIMTIHKSKGLEFAYCFFPLLSTNLNMTDLQASYGFDNKYGIYIPFADEGKSNTIIKTLFFESGLKASISEKVRLLYVALTRAREKMFIIMDDEDENINSKKLLSFKQMINYTATYNSFIKKIDLNDYNISNDYKLRTTDLTEKNTVLDLYSLEDKIGTISESKVQKEESIIDLLEEIKIKIASKSLTKLPDKTIKKNIQLGLDIHAALEVLDFSNPNIEELPVSDFIKNSIRNILSNELFSKIKNGKTYHEYEFYFNDEEDRYHGIIDLFVVYEDHIDLIDYKLSNVDDQDYVKQLNVYKRFINTKWDKKINVYLLSVLKNEIKEVLI